MFIQNLYKNLHEKIMLLFWSVLIPIPYKQKLLVNTTEIIAFAYVKDSFAPEQEREFLFLVLSIES